MYLIIYKLSLISIVTGEGKKRKVILASCEAVQIGAEELLDLSGDDDIEITERSEEQSLMTNIEAEPTNSEKVDLMELIKGNFEATSLLSYVGKALPDNRAQNLLSSLIAKATLKQNRSSLISGDVYLKWCAEIKKHYPGESISTYYIPYRLINNVTHQARGKLISQVANMRKKYRKLGVLPKKKSGFVEWDEIQDFTSDANVDKEMHWLRNNTDPWNMVEEKWKLTLQERRKFLKNKSVDEYFDEYPALMKSRSYILLKSDFHYMYPDVGNNLHLNFPMIKPKLLELTRKKSSKDAYCREIVRLSDSPNEEVTNILGMLSILQLITINTISTAPGKKKTGKEKSWRPTKEESRHSFIALISDVRDLKPTIEKRRLSLLKKSLPSHPYIVIVGTTLATVKSYFVVINPKVVYRSPNILSAVDLCFKCYWALKQEYALECHGVWYFIQKAFYKLSTSHVKSSTSAESLMTDCHIFVD